MAFEDVKAAGIAGRFSGLGLLHAVMAAGLVAGSIAEPAAAENEPAAAALPQVTIEAQRHALERSVDNFVANTTHTLGASPGDPLQLWRQPICFIVAGLPQGHAEFVLNRLSDAADAAGAPLAAKNDCRPNFYVVATAYPEELLRAWNRKDSSMYSSYEGLARVHEFVYTPRPVRVWYNTYLTDALSSGSTPTHKTAKRLSVSRGTGSNIKYSAVRDLDSVLVVIDLNLVKSLEWSQVADYIAVAGLTRVNPDADLRASDTILRLFTDNGTPAPESMTEWDKSFLHALYHTPQNVKGQRGSVADHMISDIVPPS